MPFRGKIIPQLPTGGLNNASGEQNISDSACRESQNVRYYRGDIVQRGGYALYVTPATVAATPVTGMHWMRFSGQTTRFVATAGAKILVDSGANTWTDITGTATSTSGADNLYQFCELNNQIIGTNFQDTPWSVGSAGNAAPLTGSPPARALTCITFRNRVLFGNVTSDANRGALQWCVINNPTDWTSSGAGNAAPLLQAGQEIRALAAVGNDAFVFYDKSIFRCVATGDSVTPFQFPEHEAGVGCASPYSTVTVPDKGLLFFVGPLGIYQMAAPGYRPVRISRPIDDTWLTVNKTRLKQIVARVFPKFNEVWFAVATGSDTTNSLTIVHDYDRNTWTLFKGIAANSFANYDDSAGITQLAHGDYSGFVFKNESGTSDNGTAIDAYITSKSYPLIEGVLRGSVRFVELQLAPQNTGSALEFNYGYDLQGLNYSGSVSMDAGGATFDTTGLWDASTFAIENQITAHLNTQGQGAFFTWQLRNRVLNTTFRCYGVNLGIVPVGTTR